MNLHSWRQWRLPTRTALKPALALAIPASLAAMITPLLGIVDTAVLARSGTTADVAGVALAGAVFSILYWTLGFLRMSLAGLTAQADGRGDEAAARAHLIQGVILGATIGILLAVFRCPIADVAAAIMGGADSNASGEALTAMQVYIETRLLAAPFAIAFFAGLGFLTGRGRTGLMMVVVIIATLLNALLDVYFVINLQMGTYGIALGTAIAEAAGFVLLAAIIAGVLAQQGGIFKHWAPGRLTENLSKIVALNADIFFRTFALAVVFAWFTRAGGKFGDLTLASNQVLMHITLAAGMLLDGPAIAAETLIGNALGRAKNRRRAFSIAVDSTGFLAVVGAAGLTVFLLSGGHWVLTAITPADASPALLAEAERYYVWAALSPLFMVMPFQLDGVFIGATRGRALRNSMIGACLVFAVGVFVLIPLIGNHGLWIAFGLFMVARGAFLLSAWSGFAPLLIDQPHPTDPARGERSKPTTTPISSP